MFFTNLNSMTDALRYSSNCSKEIYDKFIGLKMELGGDILCAQKLEQPTIPQGHCLPDMPLCIIHLVFIVDYLN